MNRKHLKAEVIRCGRDPEFFIKNYIKIQHPVRGLIPFNLYDYQSELINSYISNRFNVVLKARQLGISETTAAYATWLMLFRRDKNILVMATKRETAKNIIRKVHTAIKNLPKWLMLSKIVTDNVFSVELSTGSRIKAVSSAKDAGRSEAVSLLIVDEAAHIENMGEIWTGLLPTVQAGGGAIMLSTPKGVGNTFHRIYAASEKNENEFCCSKLMWWLHPERILDKNGNIDLEDDPLRPGFKTSSWFRKETQGMDPREIAQELECNFNASGDNFISAEIMDWMDKECVLVPYSFQYYDKGLHIWTPPTPATDYFISADVARGDGADHSTAHVFKISDMQQVAEYKGKLPTDEFARLLTKMGRDYNTALLAIENNNVGLACIEHVKLDEYENLYFSSRNQFESGQSFNTSFPAYDESRYVAGFTTTQRTRPLILSKLEEYIRLRKATFRSSRLIEELRKFIWNNGKPEAQRGYNDDLVIAAAIGCWLHDTFFASNYMTEEVSKTMLDCITYSSKKNTEIPGANKDPRHARMEERIIVSRTNPFDLSLPDGSIENIGWLIQKK